MASSGTLLHGHQQEGLVASGASILDLKPLFHALGMEAVAALRIVGFVQLFFSQAPGAERALPVGASRCRRAITRRPVLQSGVFRNGSARSAGLER